LSSFVSDIVNLLGGGHVFYLTFHGLTWNYTLTLHVSTEMKKLSAKQKDCGVHIFGICPMKVPVPKIHLL